MKQYCDYQNLKVKGINCYTKTMLRHVWGQGNTRVEPLMKIALEPNMTYRDPLEKYPLAFQEELFEKNFNKQIPYPFRNYVFFYHT